MPQDQQTPRRIKRAVFDAQDDPFRALAYPMARMVLERLLMGPATAIQIAEELALTPRTVQSVMTLLVTGGLVTTETPASGMKTFRYSGDGLRTVRTWLARFPG